jgi:glutamyl-tRNA synthetase
VNKSASAFNPEKLLWLNQQHMMRATPERLAHFLAPQLAALGIEVSDVPTLSAVALCQRERAKTLKEMAQNSVFFFREFAQYDDKAAKKNLTADAAAVLQIVRDELAVLSVWQAADIHVVVERIAAERSLGMGKVAQPIRVAVSGTAVSPPIDKTLEILGKATTLQRIERAIAYASQNGS